jgi:hypothetical protein
MQIRTCIQRTGWSTRHECYFSSCRRPLQVMSSTPSREPAPRDGLVGIRTSFLPRWSLDIRHQTASIRTHVLPLYVQVGSAPGRWMIQVVKTHKSIDKAHCCSPLYYSLASKRARATARRATARIPKRLSCDTSQCVVERVRSGLPRLAEEETLRQWRSRRFEILTRRSLQIDR